MPETTRSCRTERRKRPTILSRPPRTLTNSGVSENASTDAHPHFRYRGMVPHFGPRHHAHRVKLVQVPETTRSECRSDTDDACRLQGIGHFLLSWLDSGKIPERCAQDLGSSV